MEKGDKRIIDYWGKEIEEMVERVVKKVLNDRLPKPPPKYYTFAELTKMLNCSRVTLHNLRATGNLQVYRPSGMKRCLVSQAQLDQFLLENPGWVENGGEVHGGDGPPNRIKRVSERNRK